MELEWCKCGILTMMLLVGEEVICAACDVVEGQDQRGDGIQAHDDGCEVMDGGDRGVEEKAF